MGSISYKKFISAEFLHDFYESGKSPDLIVAPTPSTARRMSNTRMVFRGLPTGFNVFYRAVSKSDPNPFQSISDGVFSFALSLKNPTEFLNLTDLTDVTNSVKYKSGNIIYFRNTVLTTNAIAYELLNRLLPEKFGYDLTITGTISDDVRLRVKDYSGNVVYLSEDPLIADDNGKYHDDKVDLTAAGPGRYLIEQVKNGTPDPVEKEKVYADSGLNGTGVFGIVDIELKVSAYSFLNFVALNAFQPSFARRKTRWKYYVVNKSTNGSFTGMNINDSLGALSPYPAITFTGPTAENNVSGAETKSFISGSSPGDLIPFYESAKQGIELRNGTTVLVDDLPNPSRNIVAGEKPTLITDPDITQIFVFI